MAQFLSLVRPMPVSGSDRPVTVDPDYVSYGAREENAAAMASKEVRLTARWPWHSLKSEGATGRSS